MKHAIRCEGIRHQFGEGATRETVIEEISLEIPSGQTALLMGPSGSGKTTLLSILGCLLSPTSGHVWIDEQPVTWKSQSALAKLRRAKLGFVFQHARLLPFMSVRENLTIIGRNGGLAGRTLFTRVDELTGRLELQAHLSKRPSQLSGGQQQRVAIARALMLQPAVLLADEPTAALDWRHGQEAVQLLVDQARLAGAAVLTVTHDSRLKPMFDRVLTIESGRLFEEPA